MATSDSIHHGNSVRTPSQGAVDYNFWLHSLTQDQRFEWSRNTRGMDNAGRIALFQGLLAIPKAKIALEMELTIVQPAVDYGGFEPCQRYICTSWVPETRKRVLFSPESGFLCLHTMVQVAGK